jgi:hypothetical protein
MYSIKKGFEKGIVSGLTVALAVVAFAGFSDVTVWSLVETYIKPFVGSVTIGAVITMTINYIKVKSTK